jgi:NAD(P)H-dependent FMN reductase
MLDHKLQVLAVIGSLNENSLTAVVIHEVARQLAARNCLVDVLDMRREKLELFNPESTHGSSYYAALQKRVAAADVYLLGTPDYHGSVSSALKNFLDHFWKEFAGKLFATIVSSHEKGLTVSDQLRTIARQCYAWSLPYAVSFADKEDVKDGAIVNENFRQRLEMMCHDLTAYGTILARQREHDLAGAHPGFMARHRPKPAL